MSKVEELEAEVTRLKGAVDTKQDQIATAFAALTAERDALQELVNQGGAATEAQLQVILDGVTAAIADIEQTPAP